MSQAARGRRYYWCMAATARPGAQQATQAIHQALPHSRIAVLPGQQHVAMDTAPDLFVREVMRFLLER